MSLDPPKRATGTPLDFQNPEPAQANIVDKKLDS